MALRAFVEIAADGRLIHVSTIEYPDPSDVIEGRRARRDFETEVDQAFAAVRARAEAAGRTFLDRTRRGLPDPHFHKWDGARFVKKSRDDFGPAPAAGEPDPRPDPATFPEPPPV